MLRPVKRGGLILTSILKAPAGRSQGAQQAALASLQPYLFYCSVVCSVSVVCLYFDLINRVGPHASGALSASLKYTPAFFCLQLGLLAFPIATAMARPSLGGRILKIYLAGSTVALLAMSNEFRMPLALAACAGWFLCSANTFRLAVRRWVGDDFATWALAGASLLAALGMGCSVLAMIHALTRSTTIAFAISLMFPGAIDLWRRRAQWRLLFRRSDPWSPLDCVLCEAIWLPLAMTFVWACADEVWSDAARVHLPFARQMVIEGGLPNSVAGDWFRLTPNLVQASFAGAGALGSFRLAKWLSWFSLLCLAMVVADEAGRICRNRAVRLFAAAALLGCPILLWEATSLSVDHFAALFTTAAFAVLFRAERQSMPRAFWFSACLMGVAVQVKYQTLVPGAVWCATLLVLLLRRHPLPLAAKRFALVLSAFAVCAAPWYLCVWRATGNPVFPLFNGIFHSPRWPAHASTDFNMETFRLHGLQQWLSFPWTATFSTSKIVEGYDGWLGFWGLALFPALTVRSGGMPPSRGLCLAGVAIVFGVSLVAPYLRYWLPAYPVMLIPLVQCAARAFDRSAPRWLASFAAVPMLVAALLPLALWVGCFGIINPWLVYTHQKTNSQWMADFHPGYHAIAELNRKIDSHDNVLCTNYLAVSAVNARAFEFRETSLEIDLPGPTSELSAYLRQNDIRYWIVDHARDTLDKFLRMGCGKYWTDENIVSASQGVAIYSIGLAKGAVCYTSPRRRDIPPALVDASVDPAGWTGSPALLKALGQGTHETLEIDSCMEQTARHNFSLPSGTALVRCTLPLRAESGATAPSGKVLVTVAWFDAQGNDLGSESSECWLRRPMPKAEARRHSAGKKRLFASSESEELACVFSKVPDGATVGALMITTVNARVWIQTAQITYWQSPSPR